MILVDSWGGQADPCFRRELHSYEVEVLQIPRLTTKDIQPLDVTFMRQYKIEHRRSHKDGSIERRELTRGHHQHAFARHEPVRSRSLHRYVEVRMEEH